MRKCALLAVAFAFVVSAAEQNPRKTDQGKLQGTWTVVAVEVDGGPKKGFALNFLKLIFKGDTVTWEVLGEVDSKETINIDHTKNPKILDMMQDDGKVALGIYELAEDTLKVCYNAHGEKERPTEFQTKKGSSVSLMVLKRQKRIGKHLSSPGTEPLRRCGK